MLCKDEKYCKKLKLKKAATTGAMVCGTGLELVPTAGISLRVGIGIASVIVAGGATYSIYNTVIDNSKTKECISKIQELSKSRDSVCEKEKRLVNNLKDILNSILSEGGVTPKKAIGRTVYAHPTGPMELLDSSNNTFSVNSHKEFSSELALISIANTSFKNEMQLNNYSNDIINISYNKNTIADISTAAVNIGLEVSHHILLPIFNLLTSASVALSFVNVGVLVYEWNKIHPTVSQILELKNSLQMEINNYKTYTEVIHRFTSEGRALKVEVLKKSIEEHDEKYADTKKKLSTLEEEFKKLDAIIEVIFARLNTLEERE
jgi:hypothetical protein